MSTKIELPHGRSAVMLEADDVTSGIRKRIIKIANGMGKPDDVDATMNGLDLLVTYLFESCDYDLAAPSPQDPSPLDDIPASAMDVLYVHANAVLSTLMPDYGPSPDPASPTSPSGA